MVFFTPWIAPSNASKRWIQANSSISCIFNQAFLDPIDCNYVMSDKQIDEHVEILSAIIAKSLNDLRYKS